MLVWTNKQRICSFSFQLSGRYAHCSELLGSGQIADLFSYFKNCCTRPIIFIAHSLGGLVVKAALAEAYHGDGTYTMIQTMTYGIIFFGVPHQGSDNVSWGRVVAQIASTYDGRINESFMQSVESGSPYNEWLSKRFMPLLAKYKFLSICETLEEVKHGVNLGVVSFYILFPASRFEGNI
jgi:hypothetical protein